MQKTGRRPYVIAVEGSPLSGKSTLCGRIKERHPEILLFADYVDMLADFDTPKFNPGSTEGQLAAFGRFMDMEAARVSVAELNPSGIVLLDRSVNSLLAHSYALDRMFGYNSYGAAEKELAGRVHLVPDVTFYLSADPDILESRCRVRETTDRCDSFIEAPFLLAFSDFFDSGSVVGGDVVRLGCEEMRDGIPPVVAEHIARSADGR